MSQIKLLTSNDIYLNNKYRKYGFEEEISKETFLPFQLTNVDTSLANALRRIFVSEIDNLAFDDQIDIKVNTSQYHREVLIGRFIFITIDMDYIRKEKINYKELVFIICDSESVDKPLKNQTLSIMKVFVHSYLKVYVKKQEIPIDRICPHNSILMTLNPKEEVLVIMSPSMGHGRQHARWVSSIVMYKFATEFDLNPTDKIETNLEQLNYLGKEQKKPESLIMTIESIGKMSSYVVLKEGILSLKKKLKYIWEEIRHIPDSEIVIVESDELMPNFVKIRINEEDHTLGNVLEYACLTELKKLIGPKRLSTLLLECICGYRKPHPLDDYMELIVRTPTDPDAILIEMYQQYLLPVRLVLLAIDRVVEQCDQLLEQI